MTDYKAGSLVRSLAGHDRDRYFIILEEDGEYVTLADGRSRTVEKPKKKKKKHVRPADSPQAEGVPADNETIRRIIKNYERSHCSIEEVRREYVESRCD